VFSGFRPRTDLVFRRAKVTASVDDREQTIIRKNTSANAYVSDTRQGRHERQVGNPQSVRTVSDELAINHIRMPIARRSGRVARTLCERFTPPTSTSRISRAT